MGKNLFAFFQRQGDLPPPAKEEAAAEAGAAVVCMHVHFGMSGAWATFDAEQVPEPTATTRLRLEEILGDEPGSECGAAARQPRGLITHLSAMTVQHGGRELYDTKRLALGEDPLRADARPLQLWERVAKR